MGKEVLSTAEVQALKAYEDSIERSLDEVGASLKATIREQKLYRADFDTFEQYCQKRWNYGRNYVNKMIKAADTIKDLGTNVPKINEGQARELSKIPTREGRAEVYHTQPPNAQTASQPPKQSRKYARRS